MIGVLDYGVGNIGSIRNMLKKVGAESTAVQNAASLQACDKLVLPGVGAFDYGMSMLNGSGMREALDAAVAQGVPLLGICLGMQMLGRSSEEGHLSGLGYIPFHNQRFCEEKLDGLKIPHMGWDVVDLCDAMDPLVQGLEQPPRYYFVHSYYAVCDCAADELMRCDYGESFVAAVRHGRVWGTQFHPEKSHRFGMQLLRNFAEVC